MKTGGRALISTVLSALLLMCASHAQDTVSLTGIDVVREGDAAVIQLHTSGSADFRLDRFTMGNWVTLWSSRLSLPESSGETELDNDFSEITDLVTRATSVSGRHHGELRFYLGDQVDASAITIRREEGLTVIVIPAAGTVLPAGNVNGSPPAPGSGGSFFIPRNDNIAAETQVDDDSSVEDLEMETAEDDVDRHPVAVLGVSSEFGSDGSEANADLDELQSMVENVEINAGADVEMASDRDDNVEELRAGTVADVETSEIEAAAAPALKPSRRSGVKPGRYKSGGQHKLDEPQGIVVATAKEDDARESIMPGIDSASQQDAMADSAHVNTQQTMQDMPKDGGKADVDELVDQLSEGQEVKMQEAAPSGSNRISSPGTINDPYKPKASYTLGGTGKPLVGKASLEGLSIELFEIVGTPLDQAFTLLIAQTNYNVIVDSSVGSENNVSLSFKDGTTTLRDALDLLTTTYGLDYVVNANTIVIASEDKLYGGLIDFETKVFVLSYADPKNVKEILINTGAVGEKQVEAYLGETEYPSQGSGSTMLSSDSGTEITAKPIDTNISTTPRNAVVVKGTPAEIMYVADLIKQIDRKPKRVELEVKVCEANDTALKNLGLEFNPSSDGSISQIWTEQFDRIDYDMNPLGAIDQNRQRFQDFSIGSFDRNGLGFQATLNLQIQNGNVESLAQPTLNTVDGKQAIYFAGERIPYISSVTVEQGATTQEISFLPVGVTLNFKPRLDADDLITIDVNPVISSLTEFRQIGGVEAPRTSNRQLATTVRVMDGQPFVMAGLITNTERETISKIPMLGDFPLIGKLFRNKKKEGQRTEIIIIVTPHIYD
jgi:type II secretory pathway component GspD/PulD (secretin)